MSTRLSRRALLGSAAGAALASLHRAGLGRRAAGQPTEQLEAWSNWSGSVSWQPAQVARPETLEEVVAAVRAAAAAGGEVRVAGTGHSFVPLCATRGTTLLLSRLAGVESIDREHRQATVLAGSKLYQLTRPLADASLAMTNLPDIDRQALAGALATATHGTGRELGSLSTQMVGARLIDGRGELIECSERSNPELLPAARVSLGALGVVTHVTLQLVPAFRLLEKTWIAPFQECAEQLDELIASHRHFELFWVSDRDACLLKTLDPTEEPSDYERFEDEERLVGERVGPSGRIFPSLRNRRFNEIEYAVPAERGPECWRELRALMMGKHREITWPLEYRTVAADDAWLSPMYGHDTVTLSLHQAAGLEYRPFFRDAEAIFRNHEGRPHWGKIHTLGAGELAELYPRWPDFLRVRQELDPEGRFLNDYLRTLLR